MYSGAAKKVGQGVSALWSKFLSMTLQKSAVKFWNYIHHLAPSLRPPIPNLNKGFCSAIDCIQPLTVSFVINFTAIINLDYIVLIAHSIQKDEVTHPCLHTVCGREINFKSSLFKFYKLLLKLACFVNSITTKLTIIAASMSSNMLLSVYHPISYVWMYFIIMMLTVRMLINQLTVYLSSTVEWS